MPAIITPFTESGTIDHEAHRSNVADLWEREVYGIVIGGSTGEGPYLEPGERQMLAADARKAAPDGFVILGLAAEPLRGAAASDALGGRPGALREHRPLGPPGVLDVCRGIGGGGAIRGGRGTRCGDGQRE